MTGHHMFKSCSCALTHSCTLSARHSSLLFNVETRKASGTTEGKASQFRLSQLHVGKRAGFFANTARISGLWGL